MTALKCSECWNARCQKYTPCERVKIAGVSSGLTRLGVDRSYVDRVASGARKSDTIMRALLEELRRIQPRNV